MSRVKMDRIVHCASNSTGTVSLLRRGNTSTIHQLNALMYHCLISFLSHHYYPFEVNPNRPPQPQYTTPPAFDHHMQTLLRTACIERYAKKM